MSKRSAGVPATVVELVISGRNPEELSREFEPSAQAIRNSVAQTDRDESRRADGLTTAETLTAPYAAVLPARWGNWAIIRPSSR